MCGIFAYIHHMTPRQLRDAICIVMGGLSRLEYRGYDSAGIGFDCGKNKICLIKRTGKVAELAKAIHEADDHIDFSRIVDNHVTVSHTRWATHGEPSPVNAHPQSSDEDNTFIVVHNGIITNYKDIAKYLVGLGYKFVSETDTEVMVKLMHHLHSRQPNASFRQLVEGVIAQLEGAFACIFKSTLFPGQCVATRRGSPLLIGIRAKSGMLADSIPVQFGAVESASDDARHESNQLYPSDSPIVGRKKASMYRVAPNQDESEISPPGPSDPIEYFMASDASAIIEHTDKVVYLEDDDIAWANNGKLTIHRMKRQTSEDKADREINTLKMQLQQIMKGDYEHFMLKEIMEQPDSLLNTMRGRVHHETGEIVLGGIKQHLAEIKRCRRLLLIACGTSYHSAVASRQLLEELTELPVMIDIASDFIDRKTPIFRDDVCFFISQSGETADTLEALHYCKSHNALIVGITNTVGSTISRVSHCGVHINAGPEIGVASTKAYTSQIVCLAMFALVMAGDRRSFERRVAEIVDGLHALPSLVKRVLEQEPKIKQIAKRLYNQRSLLIMGRGHNYATALEGALKIKELTYMHCEGIQSGELKHGPLALVDSTSSILQIINRDNVYAKCITAYKQVTSRGGRPIVILGESDEETKQLILETNGTTNGTTNGLTNGHAINGHTNALTNADSAASADDVVEAHGPAWISVPETVDALQAILNVIPIQLLSYHVAVLKGCNVDCPRNLAKSVTVG